MPLGAAGVRDVDADGEEPGLASCATGVFVEIRSGAGEQRAAVVAAEHAGVHAGPDRDLVDDLTGLAHPDQPAAEGIGHPQGTLGIEAAAVGGDDELP